MRFGYFYITDKITDLVMCWLLKNNHPRARREENIREYILVIGITIEKHLTVLGIIRLTVMFE